MINSDIVQERIIDVIKDVLELDELVVIQRKTTANDIDGWDSLAHINIVVSVEREFNVQFQLSDIKNLLNVGDFIDLVLRKKGVLVG